MGSGGRRRSVRGGGVMRVLRERTAARAGGTAGERGRASPARRGAGLLPGLELKLAKGLAEHLPGLIDGGHAARGLRLVPRVLHAVGVVLLGQLLPPLVQVPRAARRAQPAHRVHPEVGQRDVHLHPPFSNETTPPRRGPRRFLPAQERGNIRFYAISL